MPLEEAVLAYGSENGKHTQRDGEDDGKRKDDHHPEEEIFQDGVRILFPPFSSDEEFQGLFIVFAKGVLVGPDQADHGHADGEKGSHGHMEDEEVS